MPFQFRKEAIEEDLNTNFPSQGQGNPPLYYSLSEVVVPTYSINQVAEGSPLPETLQQAWDFSTGHAQVINTTSTIINNAGFWKVDLTFTDNDPASGDVGTVFINDGVSSKTIWQLSGLDGREFITDDKFFVFLRSGDTLQVTTTEVVNIWYRQVADVNGNLVNPLGFSAA